MTNRVFLVSAAAVFLTLMGCSTLRTPVTGPRCVEELNRIEDQELQSRKGLVLTPPTPAVMEKWKEQVILTFESGSSDYKKCYETYVSKGGYEQGSLKFLFLIRADGKVPRSCVIETYFANSDFQTCVLRRLESTGFPKPPGGGSARIAYPFKFIRTSN